METDQSRVRSGTMERETSQARVRRTGTMDRERVGGFANGGRERDLTG